jgi:hypothetical protein
VRYSKKIKSHVNVPAPHAVNYYAAYHNNVDVARQMWIPVENVHKKSAAWRVRVNTYLGHLILNAFSMFRYSKPENNQIPLKIFLCEVNTTLEFFQSKVINLYFSFVSNLEHRRRVLCQSFHQFIKFIFQNLNSLKKPSIAMFAKNIGLNSFVHVVTSMYAVVNVIFYYIIKYKLKEQKNKINLLSGTRRKKLAPDTLSVSFGNLRDVFFFLCAEVCLKKHFVR